MVVALCVGVAGPGERFWLAAALCDGERQWEAVAG